MNPDVCIVLAGGKGTRLRSAVPNLPKCLAPISEHSFLELQLTSLARRGVKQFLLALGYGANQVIDSIRQPWADDLNISYVIEDGILGTGGAARFAMSHSKCNEALIINGDTFLWGPLDAMMTPLDIARGELMRMATVHIADRSRFGGVLVDASDCVIDFFEKGESGPGPINAGLYRISMDAFEGELSSMFSMETAIMPRLMNQKALRACELVGPFIDIGVPHDYEIFKNLYERHDGNELSGF